MLSGDLLITSQPAGGRVINQHEGAVMATQGIVSILDIDGKKMLFKAIAGSNGYNASRLAAWALNHQGALTIERIYEAALKVGFGTKEALVVQDSAGSLCFDADECCAEDFGALYHDDAKFRDPRFNPRWKNGTADCIEVVTLQLFFQQGYAVVARRNSGDVLRSFHSSDEDAENGARMTIDIDPLRVEPAEVSYASNGNVRMWRLKYAPA